MCSRYPISYFCFFFNVPATTEIYTLSLHDALPIFLESRPTVLRGAPLDAGKHRFELPHGLPAGAVLANHLRIGADRKSTRLNSSHVEISYAVFCLKKKTMKEHAIGLRDNELITTLY